MTALSDIYSRAETLEGTPLEITTNWLTIPSATTAQLAAVGDIVNTSPKKVAGTIVYNSTVGSIVVAEGPLAADVWNSAAGVTAHTPI